MTEFEQETISEILEKLDNLEANLLQYENIIENNDDLSFIHILFRLVHNLKGLLSMTHYENASKLIHTIENFFDKMKNGKIVISKELIDKFLHAIDLIRNNISNPDDSVDEINDLIPGIENFEVTAVYLKPVKSYFKFEDYEINLLISANENGLNVFQIEKLIIGNIKKDFYQNLPIYEDIKEIGNIIKIYPKFENLNKDSENVVKIIFSSNLTEDEVGLNIFDPFGKLSVADLIDIKKLKKQKLIRESSLKILLVEDNIVNLKLLQCIMTDYGFCDTAINGTDAIEKYKLSLKGKPYDLICLDIQLPDIYGLEVLTKIRVLEEDFNIIKNSKIMMITVMDDLDTITKSFDKKCDAYLFKPILKENVEKQLNRMELI